MPEEASSPELSGKPARRPRTGDVLGIFWLALFVFLFLAPALKDGPSFAPADLGSGLSVLTVGAVPLSHNCVAGPGTATPVSCPHNDVNGDEIDQAVPWSTTNWQLVHKGELPWWNDLEGNGLPQFLNFESASFSLPSLVSYLGPESLNYLLIVAMKMLIAGIGAYWCCRLLGARPLAASLGGTTYMLSGSFAGWLGWSLTGTLCWVGFLLGGVIWAYRTPRRVLPPTVIALSLAFAIYGGFVEAYALLAGFLVLVVLGAGAATVLVGRRVGARPVARIALGVGAGVALGAPLWLPGLSVLGASIRSGENDVARGLAPHGVALLFAQGYDGLPIAGSTFFGAGLPNYFESAGYLGVVSIALAGLALLCCWRRPAVVGIACGGLGALLLTYRLPGSPVQHLVRAVGLGAIDVSRILPLVGFATGLLAALGAERLLQAPAARGVRRGLLVAGGLVTVVVVLLGAKALSGLPAPELGLRQASLYWPVATIVVVGVAALLLLPGAVPGATRPFLGGRGGSALVGLMLVAESAFLLFAGVGINSYAERAFPATPATSTLSAAVGSSLVALDWGGVNCFRGLVPPAYGYYPNVNVGYGVDELAVHDPIAPSSYFDSWPIPNVGQSEGGGCAGVPTAGVNLFVPSVNTLALARRYGAGFVLAAPGQIAPRGMSKVEAIGTMTLYAVPDSPRFSFSGGKPLDAVRSARAVGDAAYQVRVAAPRPGMLEARVTDSPGWHASSGGRALSVKKVDSAFLLISVPAGASEIDLSYRPPHLALALALALAGLLALVVVGALMYRARNGASREENVSGFGPSL